MDIFDDNLAQENSVSEDEALEILNCHAEDMPRILAGASKIRFSGWGNSVRLCSILNAKSGGCGEDCAFCAQSSRHDAETEVYDLVSEDRIVEAFDRSSEFPLAGFSIVTSGKSMDDGRVREICRAIHSRTDTCTRWCASLGSLTASQFVELKRAGLERFHHNLETAGSFFPEICSTHTFEERLQTLRRAREAGLKLCSGGIIGIGESLEQRVELAFTLKNEKVDSIPLNFHIPIGGTPLENIEPLAPLDILRVIAMFRLVNPAAEIIVCAGRLHLRDLQSMIFQAGATGMMVGSFLTVAGRGITDDLQMIKDLELDPRDRNGNDFTRRMD